MLAVFDIGGTFVKCGLFDDGKISHQAKFPTPKTFEEMLSQMKSVLDSYDETITGVALSAPGTVNTKKRVIEGLSAVPYIHQRPIFDEFEAAFGLPVAIENDANCAGICEMKSGAGQGYQNAAFVVLGTGVGGAVFINGQIYKGSHLFGGEFGLMKNRQETNLSGNGTVVKAAAKYAKLSGREVSGIELFELEANGDTLAHEVLEEMYQNIANLIYNLQVSLDPEIIILGGGVSARSELPEKIRGYLKQTLEQELIPEVMPEIVCCHYQNDANLLGAAYNFLDQNK